MTTASIVLVGDSIFDNAAYVPGEPCVTDQLRGLAGSDVDVSLLAVDGSMIRDIERQTERLPPEVTHLFLSVGGNDALSYAQELLNEHNTAADILGEWSRIQKRFRSEYREMLAQVVARGLKTMACTIYDAVPNIDEVEMTALSLFNDVIVDECVRRGLSVIDMRRVCAELSDYSRLSPIEPSSAGGAKIAGAVHRAFSEHDFATPRTIIYT